MNKSQKYSKGYGNAEKDISLNLPLRDLINNVRDSILDDDLPGEWTQGYIDSISDHYDNILFNILSKSDTS